MVDIEKLKALALAAPDIKHWQVRCDWTSDRPAAALMVEAMKEENAELRAEVERLRAATQPAPIPALTDEAINDLWRWAEIEWASSAHLGSSYRHVLFARAIASHINAGQAGKEQE